MSNGAGDEVLHLVGLVAVALEEQGQVDHRVQVAAGVAGDVVRHDVLLFAGASASLLELAVELSKFVVRRASSSGPARRGRCARGRPSDGRRRDAAASSRMYSGDGGPGPCGCRWRPAPCGCPALRGLAHQFDERAVVGAQQLADRRDGRTTAGGTWPRLPGRVQRIWYMLAVGPPMSLMTPLNSGSAAILRISVSTDSWLAAWMMRPSCAVMEQNVQPPKQPRMICTESLIISYAGIWLAVARMRPARVRQAVDAIHFGLRQRKCRRIDHHGLPVRDTGPAAWRCRDWFRCG